MTEKDIKQANRRAHCQKRAELHEGNRATKRAREKAQRAIAQRADAFCALEIFLHRKDLATLDYSNDNTRIRLTRKDENEHSRQVGFVDAIGEEYDEPEDDYTDEDEEDGLNIRKDVYNSFEFINDLLKRRRD